MVRNMFFLLAFTLLGTGLVQAQTVVVDDIMYRIDKEAGIAAVAGYVSYPYYVGIKDDVVILASVECEGMEYPVVAIDDCAFKDSWKAIRSIDIPDGVASIGDEAFYGCTQLEKVNIPQSVTAIGDFAFYECTILSDISIPQGVMTIGDYAFRTCWFLKSMFIPDGVVNIGIAAFSDCTALEVVTLPSTLETISRSLFYGCMSLRSVNVPEGVTVIDHNAFSGCTELENIELPQGLERIGMSAFRDCSSLRSVVLHANLRDVGSGTFADCPLEDIYCQGGMPPAIAEETFDEATYAEAVLHVPSDAAGSYQAAQWWSQFLNVEGDMPPVSVSDALSVASFARYADGVVITESPATIDVYAPGGARVLHAAGVTSLSLESLPRGIYIIGVEAEGLRQMLTVLR